MAPGADEGRDKLRKASGRSKYPYDPKISEWGNPSGVNARTVLGEHIA